MSTEEVVICPEYSAVGAKKLSSAPRATQAAIKVLGEEGSLKVAEIGCGLLANTPYILEAFPHVVLVDTKLQYQRINSRLSELSSTYTSFKGFVDAESFQRANMQFDGAIVINILHVLPTQEGRVHLLAGAYKNLRRGGLVFVDAPYNETFYRSLVKTARVYNDGYIMRRGGNYYTFYRNINFNELREYAEKAGFEYDKRVYLDHRVSIVCRK